MPSADAIVSPMRPAVSGAVADARDATRLRRESRCSRSPSIRSRSESRSKREEAIGCPVCQKKWPAGWPAGRSGSVHVLEPGIDVLLGFVLGIAVTFLQTAGELGALALDHIEVVIRELAPFLLYLALERLPVTFHAVPVHVLLPWCCAELRRSRGQHGANAFRSNRERAQAAPKRRERAAKEPRGTSRPT